MITTVAGLVEAWRVCLKIGQPQDTHLKVRLHQSDDRLEVLPVRTVMACEQDGRDMEAQRVDSPQMVANVLKVNPGRDGGEPGPLLPDSFPGPHSIAT